MTEIKLTPGGIFPEGCPIPLGRRGENGATQIMFDYSAWAEAFGEGAVSLRLRRNGDGTAYPILLTSRGHTAEWLVSDVDTATEGRGIAQYSYTVGETVVKSWIFPVVVAASLAETGEAPDPYEDWIEQLTELAAETQQAATDAEAASVAVQNMGVEAEALQPGSAPTVTKSVDPETGAVTLVFGLPSGGGGSGGAVDSVNGKTGEVTLDAEDVGALPADADLDDIPDGSTYKRATAAQLAQIATNAGDIAALDGRVDGIENKIPAAASAQNQLADKAFVNSSVQTNTAHFRGNWPTWADVPTNAAGYPSDDDGSTTPTTNDYMVVQDASGYPVPQGKDTLKGTWRFKYAGIWATNNRNGWEPEYQVNETPLTQAQLDALNSGATAAIISSVGDKLDKAGDGSNVTAAFSTASSRVNIATGEKLSVLFGKIAKWLGDLGTAAFRAATATLEAGSTALIEAGAVYTAIASKAPSTAGVYYGECSTAAATQEKAVTVSGITSLYDGLRVTVLFANAQSSSGAPTLNVNGLGAAPIRRTLTANAAIYEWQAGQVLTLVYATDSGVGCWVIDNGALATTTYAGRVKLQTSAASESESMAATPQSINQLAQSMISGAPIYANGSFAAGDLCRRGAVIYRRISAGTDAAWTASNWEALPPLLEMLEQGGVQVVTVSGTTPTITTLPGVRYVCGECATLDITPPASGICDVIFTSGSTATVLTVTGTVRWANGFDPTSLDTDTTYELSILDGLGVAASWT